MIGTWSIASLRLENFAGTVWLSAGAPGTFQLPLTSAAVSCDGACEPGSSVPARPDTECVALSPWPSWLVVGAALDGPDWSLVPEVLRFS